MAPYYSQLLSFSKRQHLPLCGSCLVRIISSLLRGSNSFCGVPEESAINRGRPKETDVSVMWLISGYSEISQFWTRIWLPTALTNTPHPPHPPTLSHYHRGSHDGVVRFTLINVNMVSFQCNSFRCLAPRVGAAAKVTQSHQRPCWTWNLDGFPIRPMKRRTCCYSHNRVVIFFSFLKSDARLSQGCFECFCFFYQYAEELRSHIRKRNKGGKTRSFSYFFMETRSSWFEITNLKCWKKCVIILMLFVLFLKSLFIFIHIRSPNMFRMNWTKLN